MILFPNPDPEFGIKSSEYFINEFHRKPYRVVVFVAKEQTVEL